MILNIDDYVYGNVVYEAKPVITEVIADNCSGCAFDTSNDDHEGCFAAADCSFLGDDNLQSIIWVEKQ